MLKWLLTRKRPADPAPEPIPASVRERVQRLEIALGELEQYVEQLRGQHGKLRSAFYGHIGAENRNRLRNGHNEDESLDEFRARMLAEGRLRPQQVNSNGEQ